MNKKILFMSLLSCLFVATASYAGTIINKDDAALFSKQSKYSRVIDQELIDNQNMGKVATNDQVVNFTVPKAKKDGDKYTNTWSNYSISFEDKNYVANDYYDFNSEGVQYDFGIYFKDFSRLAVYYSTLSRDLNQIAKKFSPKGRINEVVVGGEVYKHVTLDEKYPYGVLIYDYYLRNVDNKLMVIECFHEKSDDVAPTYISKFVKVN